MKKMGLFRVLKEEVNEEQRERLGRQKEIWDNTSPYPPVKFEKMIAVFPSNTNASLLNAATHLH